MPAAELTLASPFGDHAILQRDLPLPVWGQADPGTDVTVAFAGQTKTATADAHLRWQVTFDPVPASVEPRDLRVRAGTTTLIRTDIVVGEVWLASGQSNMGVPLSAVHNAASEVPKATDPLLRFFRVPTRTGVEPMTDVKAPWQAMTPEVAKGCSAVAYFFARDLRHKLTCPVGVMTAPWGGTPIEAWISLEGFKREPAITKALTKWDEALAAHAKVIADPTLTETYQRELKQWQKDVAPAYNDTLREYNQAVAAGKSVGKKPQPSRPEPTNPDPMAMPSPSRRPGTPTVNFNGMIAPLIPYALRGMVWYQGEANGGAGLEYRILLPRLIDDWRSRWVQQSGTKRETPVFLFVQLPSNGPDTTPVAIQGWPWLREAQFMTLSLPRTGMAITIDVGNPKDVHPAGKEPVGQRLALLARKIAYGENLVASGPLYQDFKVEAKGIRITFRETGSGLTIGQSPWYANGVEPYPNDKVIGFFVAGEDKKWEAADVKIDGHSVIVSNSKISKPVAVRYGWAASPRCNLYNKEGLPASPFRTDGE